MGPALRARAPAPRGTRRCPCRSWDRDPQRGGSGQGSGVPSWGGWEACEGARARGPSQPRTRGEARHGQGPPGLCGEGSAHGQDCPLPPGRLRLPRDTRSPHTPHGVCQALQSVACPCGQWACPRSFPVFMAGGPSPSNWGPLLFLKSGRTKKPRQEGGGEDSPAGQCGLVTLSVVASRDRPHPCLGGQQEGPVHRGDREVEPRAGGWRGPLPPSCPRTWAQHHSWAVACTVLLRKERSWGEREASRSRCGLHDREGRPHSTPWSSPGLGQTHC